jgi:phosphomevalonate kinase
MDVMDLKRVVSAPGKVLITGGYLILEQPNSGLVLSTSARFFAIVEPINTTPVSNNWAWVRQMLFDLALY